ncbi:MAG TPA: histidinol-phosphate transaminase [Patescibacteria group bacterium]|nr:histidinol-phosphate transaminase [Patescibacteria group bacterium]
MSDPTAPASYSWEATSEQVAARYGIPIDEVVRFDLNTSPTPPELAARILSAGRFETSLSEYPPSDYRRLSEAAAARYGAAVDEILVGAGADEILDIAAKTFLPPGGTAVIPTPSYAMYRVLTEQRAARVRTVPRLGAAAGWAIDLGLTRTIARGADLVWLCSPNNPTALAEPDGAIAGLLADLLVDAERDGRAAPVVVLDEAYAEFVGTSLHPLRAIYPGLVVVRTLSKAYALAGLRVGFALAARPTIAALEPYRPPGSVATTSVTVATEVLRDPTIVLSAVERVQAERERLSAALRSIGWRPGPSVTNFVLIAFDSPERSAAVADGLLRRGLVPRTFPSSHPLADHLRLTVRSMAEDDRLIAAAAEIEAELGEDAR